MSTLPNPKHERFAQALAAGKTAEEAYGEAGYRPNRGNAATLKANQSISQRVAEIQTAAADMVAIDKAWVLQKLRLNYERADQAAEFGACNRALELIGKELGMFEGKGDDASENDVDAMTADQRKQLKQDAIAALESEGYVVLLPEHKSVEVNRA